VVVLEKHFPVMEGLALILYMAVVEMVEQALVGLSLVVQELDMVLVVVVVLVPLDLDQHRL
jgi:hypothetical protein